jgi:CRISPR-associated endonuclease/helicase Cas3
VFAHSLDGHPVSEWEPLSHHLAAVGERAAAFAAAFGWAEAARAAGQLHDIGKCSVAFQAYIARPGDENTAGRRGPDHSTAGARAAVAIYPYPAGRLLAFGIAGHHAGLADAKELDRRLDDAYAIEPHDGWQAHSGETPATTLLVPPTVFDLRSNTAFTAAFLARMLFSCLVDADFLETEAFYARAKGDAVERGGFAGISVLSDRLQRYMEDKRAASPKSSINALRDRVLDHAVRKTTLSPGLFTLTVPTGGGKTLASLSFALEHAVFHGMERVIYVIPYTSIIEQTAGVFREALSTTDDVLEHHASFDWEAAGPRDSIVGADDEGPGGVNKLRRAAENWDAPIVVTTAVQFFESLFANRTSRCRKLHNLAGAVIVLDEAQTLPIHLLRPCMGALDELCRNYGASVVLCTATQPALREKDGFKWGGFRIDDDRELAPEPQALYAALKRVTVETLTEPIGDAVIATRFSEQPTMLCIVNSRAHARSLFEMIRALPGAMHLTTLMCPRHRQAVLKTVRTLLDPNDPQPVRLVATSLIEAGVDVDFPEVWRAAAGLDSIAQAAGRCNREGRLERGRTVVFEPADNKPPRTIEAYWQATRSVLRTYDELLGLESIKAYFSELYWQKGPEALDAAKVDGRPGILATIDERAGDFSFPFRGIAEAFRLIDEIMVPVIVPWRADASDDVAERLLDRIASMDRPRAADLRRLQQYTVSIPCKAHDIWLAAGVLRPVHRTLGPGLLRFEDLAHYRPDTGVDIDAIGLRSVEANIM